MIIKKVGELVLVRLKLFKVIAAITPVLMFLSLFTVYFSLDLKEEYIFQEPSLRTKLEDVRTHKTGIELPYISLIQGIQYIKIQGAMDNECILLTYPEKHAHYPQIKNIYQTILKSPFNPKNTILLSYQSPQHLQKFFQWYYNPKLNINHTFGIIRIGLNFQIEYQKNDSLAEDKKQVKNKAFFDIYSISMHPDLDYYQGIKQLLELTLFSFIPCEKVLQEPFRTLRNGFVKLGKLLKVQHETKGLADNIICDLSNHLIHNVTPHEIMMLNGFQAGSIKFIVAASSQKSEQIVVSFVKEFNLQEEHLHSARVFFYPMSRTEQLHLGAFIRSGLVFTIAVIIFLIDQFIKLYDKNIVSYPLSIVCVILVWTYEFSYLSSNVYTLILALLLFVCSIGRQGYQLLMTESKLKLIHKQIVQYLMVPVTALISLYFGLFCFPLSIIAIITACFMLAKPQRLLFRVGFKIGVLALTLFCLLQMSLNYSLSPETILKTLQGFSPQLNSILILFFMELSF